jgi:long-chain fatty acid transport protein
LFTGTGSVLAGGYALPHQTATAVGLSNAVIAGVDDPSAVYYNPAALGEVDGNQLIGGLSYLNTASSVSNSGMKARNRGDDNFIPAFFANFHIPNTKLTLGVGTYSPFGLSTRYDKDALTRYAAVETELKPIYLNWAAAWHPLDFLSIGAGVSYVHASATLSRAIFLDFTGFGTPDGRAKLSGTTDTAAYNLGLLLKPHGSLKLGLAYRSRAYLDFKGSSVRFRDFDGTTARTRVASGGSLVLPAVVSAGVYWQVTPAWSVEFVYDWTKWDDFASFKTGFGEPLPALGGLVPIPGLLVSADWKNTSTLRLGSLLHLNNSWDYSSFWVTWLYSIRPGGSRTPSSKPKPPLLSRLLLRRAVTSMRPS